MRIVFLSISDRPVLSDTTYTQLRAYCEMHGYDVEIRREALDKSRHISWSKIPLLLHHMERGLYEYYIWMDDDIYITDTQVKLESFITDYGFDQSDADLLLSADVVDECPFNAGVLIVKNTPSATRVLQETWKLCDRLQNHFSGLWEQDAFTYFYQHIDSSRFLIVPHRKLQSFWKDHGLVPELKWRPGDFAAHITGMPLEKRLEMLKEIQVLQSFDKS